MKTSTVKNIYFLLIVSVFLISAESIAAPPAPMQYRDARFKDLGDIETLKKLFDKDSDKIRLYLLMSPT